MKFEYENQEQKEEKQSGYLPDGRCLTALLKAGQGHWIGRGSRYLIFWYSLMAAVDLRQVLPREGDDKDPCGH